MSERPAKVEIYLDSSAPEGKWRWRVRASNGQVTATAGEPFDSKSNAIRGVPKQFSELELVLQSVGP